MAIKINNNSYSGFFLNGEAINTIYLNGNQVFGNGGSEPTGRQFHFADWLKNAGGTGSTIYAPANALWNSSDSKMYIPSNWTVEKIL